MLRASIRNLVSPIGHWNMTCNARTDVFTDFTCYNNVKHKKPASFPGQIEWYEHAKVCYDHKRETSSRRK